jgi:hypothetical protein
MDRKGSFEMLRFLVVLTCSVLTTGVSPADDQTPAPQVETAAFHSFTQDVPPRSAEFFTSLRLTSPAAQPAQQSCCKICTVGKACGNTCIAREKTCHVGPGCACDG